MLQCLTNNQLEHKVGPSLYLLLSNPGELDALPVKRPWVWEV